MSVSGETDWGRLQESWREVGAFALMPALPAISGLSAWAGR